MTRLTGQEAALVVVAMILAGVTSWAMWTLDMVGPGPIPVPEPAPVVVGLEATG